jgi:hypothetical protein
MQARQKQGQNRATAKAESKPKASQKQVKASQKQAKSKLKASQK